MNLRTAIGTVGEALPIVFAVAKSHRPIRRGPRHRLDAPLIISLTSYPPRYRTLARSLRCLLNQSISPDRVILWIAEPDVASLPSNVTSLRAEGLDIRTCPDWRSLKKIAPTLLAFPGSYIATADDDLYYPRDWLEQMVALMSDRIVTRNARTPIWRGASYAPIREWPMAGPDGLNIFLTGAGVLFPPDSLHPDVTNYALFDRIAPTCDDTWISWHAARAGSSAIRFPKPPDVISWERTTAGSLRVQNFGANFESSRQDEIIAAMVREYGPLHDLKR